MMMPMAIASSPTIQITASKPGPGRSSIQAPITIFRAPSSPSSTEESRKASISRAPPDSRNQAAVTISKPMAETPGANRITAAATREMMPSIQSQVRLRSPVGWPPLTA